MGQIASRLSQTCFICIKRFQLKTNITQHLPYPIYPESTPLPSISPRA